MHAKRLFKGALLTAVAVIAIPTHVFALAISSGSTVNLGNTGNAVVGISNPGGRGTGTVIQIKSDGNGGQDLVILTADHVLRDAGGGGSTLYSSAQNTVTFGAALGGPMFTASDEATDFDIPQDGSSFVDLAMLDVDVPAAQVANLPANLAAVALPGAQPAANAAIVQAGFGRRASVVPVSGNNAYGFSPFFGDGGAYGTLLAGNNTVNGAGVTNITGAVSDFAGQQYQYAGFQNGFILGGNAGNNFAGSTSYIFSGDSGGPSLSGNTILGVHSSSFTGTYGTMAQQPSEFAYPLATNASYLWQDVSVFDNLAWINATLATISPVPEPAMMALIGIGLLSMLRKRAA